MGAGFLIAGLLCLPSGIAVGIYRTRNWERYSEETPPFEIPYYFFGATGSVPWGSKYHKWLYIGSAFGVALVPGLGFTLVGGAAVLNINEF